MKTEGTDQRIAFISSVFEIEEKENLIDFVASLSTRLFAQDAARNVKLPMPKEPKSDAHLEEFEKFQADVDTYEDRKNQAYTDYIVKALAQQRTQLEGETMEKLRKMYERLLVDEMCEREMVNKFKEYCTYCGIYKDTEYKTKVFKDITEFENLPTEIKTQFIDAYNNLDLNLDELKKSLEATP